MKKYIVPVVCVLALVSIYVLAQDGAPADAEKPVAEGAAPAADQLKTVQARGGYAIAYQQGEMLKKEYPGINFEALKLGMSDIDNGVQPRLGRDDLMTAPVVWQDSKGAADPEGTEVKRGEDGVMIPTTVAQKASYVLGLNIASMLKGQLFAVDVDAVVMGLEHQYNGKEAILNEEQRKEAFDGYAQFAQKKRAELMEERRKQGELNKTQGAKFLAENAKAEGVRTTRSGLQYKVLKAGTGESPTAADTVRVHYHGTLLNGDVFDSSVERDEPAEFPLNGVIKGWTEGLQLMKEGAKYRFWIPSGLAYGEQGSRMKIAPNATLIFDVELLKIVE